MINEAPYLISSDRKSLQSYRKRNPSEAPLSGAKGDKNSSISLIVPCYNEEANLQKGVLDKVGNYTKNSSRITEVIIVDDGSDDGSIKIIQPYLKLFPRFKLIKNAHQGKAFAISTGIKSALNDIVIFTDMDLATPIEEVEKLIEQADLNYDIVIGSRKSKRDGAPFQRKILSFGAVVVRSLLFKFKGISDTQCGFKLYNKNLALNIINHSQLLKKDRHTSGPSVTAAFDLEFLFLAFKFGYKVKEVPVHWQHMESRRVNFFKDMIETLEDIIKIKIYDIQGKY